MQVPSGVVLLTDRRVARGGLVPVVAAAVAGGVRWVVLREKDLPRVERLVLAAELRSILTEAGGTLVVGGPDPLLDGDPGRTPIALHLPAVGPYPPPPADLVGRSCHDVAELRRLTTEDYVTLSPVFPTRTKPGYGPPLLPAGLAELIRRSPVPALALGGIETPAQVRACVQAGASGVAVLGTIMRAQDPQQTAATLTAAFHDVTAPTPKPPTRHVPAGNGHDGAAADRAHAGIKPDRPEWARSAAALNRNPRATTPDQKELP
ncbi:thiamine phosphate synthase [Verrucosispora sp. CWR15]|uniref:Thiamine phosphate synthase n=1 Tax=Verrucosispora sioxanthis TaxID=2499994 RepID=A0A6M1KYI4_9ACTN|nr:thiamine phosphate synthase [Verrucosispora sioxanthis]NGM13976.1 thiamine phosphate synthase [Verrucosispora sioxanthis]